MALAALLLPFILLDALGLALLGRRHGGLMPGAGFFFRSDVDLAKIELNAIVLVGDSMVFGQGVEAHQSFPGRLAHQLAGSGPPVYNLGQVGTGTNEYLRLMKTLPRHGISIACFFMNDMPTRERPGLQARLALMATARTSLAARLLADLVGVRAFPSIDAHEAHVIGDYDPRDASYPGRFAHLRSNLEAISVEAKRRTRQQPMLVVLPMLSDFSTYPLRGAHRSIGELGEALGFEVVDLLPVLSAAFPDGKRFRVAPNDNHPTAEVHSRIADELKGRLARRAGLERHE